jgi:hypothetical protein
MLAELSGRAFSMVHSCSAAVRETSRGPGLVVLLGARLVVACFDFAVCADGSDDWAEPEVAAITAINSAASPVPTKRNELLLIVASFIL